MSRMVLASALALMLAVACQANNDPAAPEVANLATVTTDPQKVVSCSAHISNGNSFLLAVYETCYKDCTFTVKKNGRSEQVMKKVPYTVCRNVPIDRWESEVVGYDRHGSRVEQTTLRTILMEWQPVLVISQPAVNAEILNSSRTSG